MDDDKPFKCDYKGCKQRFANSDHLAVHKQKHLNVKLGFKTSESVIDQTPTPTRFLKNLDEESGLFADLENPFDQDFNKAAGNESVPSSSGATLTFTAYENTPTVSVSVPVNTSGDTFSALTTLSHVSSWSGGTTSSKATLNSATVVVLNKSNPTSLPSTGSLPGLSKNIVAIIANPSHPVPKATKMPTVGSSEHKGTIGGEVISVPAPAIVTSGSTLPRIVTSIQHHNISNTDGFSHSNAMSIAKQRLKESLQQHAANAGLSASQILNISTNSNSPGALSSSPSPTKSEPFPDDENDSYFDTDHSSHKRSRRSQDELHPDQRRNKFLERNRAAASRCRQKRKIWVQQLEKRAEDLGSTNSHLQNEISQLRSEVAQLKALLLAHKECPVTLQQQAIFNQVTNGGRSVSIVTNGIPTSTASAEEVASSALTDMANRATIEMENRHSAATIVITSNNPASNAIQSDLMNIAN